MPSISLPDRRGYSRERRNDRRHRFGCRSAEPVPGIAAAQSADYQAAVAQMNAKIAYAERNAAVAAGQQQATVTSQKAAQEFASQGGLGRTGSTSTAGRLLMSRKEPARKANYHPKRPSTTRSFPPTAARRRKPLDYAQASEEKATAEEAPIRAALAAGGGRLSNISSVGSVSLFNPNWMSNRRIDWRVSQ